MRYAIANMILAGLLLFIAACSGQTPAGPTTQPPTPQPATWMLTGRVTTTTGVAVSGATVTVLDGPNAGRRAVADTSGRYVFTDRLQAGGFSVRADDPTAASLIKGITLTNDATLDFQLPRAILTFEGELQFITRTDGAYDIRALASNTGDACATNIAGTTTITSTATTATLTFPWTLAGTVRPGERVAYTFGPASVAQVTSIGSAGTYTTRFSFASAVCL